MFRAFASSLLLLVFAAQSFAADEFPTIAAVQRLSQWCRVDGRRVLLESLIGQTEPSSAALRHPDTIQPPHGIEVVETVETNRDTGEEISRDRTWEETIDENYIKFVRIKARREGRYSIGLTILARDRPGCVAFAEGMFDRNGTLVSCQFWRNTPALRITGSEDFPSDLCPYGVDTARMVLQAIGKPASGVRGSMNVQSTLYSYFRIDALVTGIEQVSVPAGRFAAVEIVAWLDLRSLYPSMSAIVARTLEAFAPNDRMYVEANPPYRLVKHETERGVGGPKVLVEMTRVYVAGSGRENGMRDERSAADGLRGPAGGEPLPWSAMLGVETHNGGRASQRGEPPVGVEVREYIQNERSSGLEALQIRKWQAPYGDDGSIQVEWLSPPSAQYIVAFWVLPSDPRGGCLVYGRTMYDRDGQPIYGRFWRNDPALRIAGTRDAQPALYPENVPPEVVLRVFDGVRIGASGMLTRQVTEYTYAGARASVPGVERIDVPAGSFDALRVVERVDLATILPSIPEFLADLLEVFMPKNVLYFDTQPPHRLLMQAGRPEFGRPEVMTRLIRYYTAADPNRLASMRQLSTKLDPRGQPATVSEAQG